MTDTVILLAVHLFRHAGESINIYSGVKKALMLTLCNDLRTTLGLNVIFINHKSSTDVRLFNGIGLFSDTLRKISFVFLRVCADDFPYLPNFSCLRLQRKSSTPTQATVLTKTSVWGSQKVGLNMT